MRLSRLAVLLLVSLVLAPPPLLARVEAQAPPQAQAPAPELTRDEMRQFLLKAKIIGSKPIGKGVTRPMRLTLTDGTLTHDAAFQSIDEKKAVANLAAKGGGPSVEFNFVDAYRYNLAAEKLAGLVGLDDMMPVYVERSWNQRTGSLSWWVETMMEEGERLKRKIEPPDGTDWNNQMYRMRVFAALTRDTDRNIGNVLITPDWKVMMIDFTRAFRLQPELPNTKDLAMCDRALLAKLEALTKNAVRQAVGDDLTGAEVDAVIKRRDLLVAHYRKQISERGEAAVLY